MLIFDQDILEQIVVCEYKKKNLCLFYFCLFNKGEWHSNWEGMEKMDRDD